MIRAGRFGCLGIWGQESGESDCCENAEFIRPAKLAALAWKHWIDALLMMVLVWGVGYLKFGR